MKLLYASFALYFLGIYMEIYTFIFERRIRYLLINSRPLSDSRTVKMSAVCWHLRHKFMMKEKRFLYLLKSA